MTTQNIDLSFRDSLYKQQENSPLKSLQFYNINRPVDLMLHVLI
jgi:hypothetical protein